MSKSRRCAWAETAPEHMEYHDTEWCIPSHEDGYLFEMLLLEGFQAGLSWLCILKKRQEFAREFANWDFQKIARFSDARLEKILQNPGVVRNRLKIYGARESARSFIEVRKEFGSFDKYIWGFTGGKVIKPKKRYRELSELPAESELSRTISRDLKKRGFKFCGPTIIYSYLQAIGIIDDHMAGCPFISK